MLSNVELIQELLPQFYKKYEFKEDLEKSVLYSFINAFAIQLGNTRSIIDRVYADIGIDSTSDEDLEFRWGALLNMYKYSDESYDNYRSRLCLTYSTLVGGGTEKSIKFAVAAILGVHRDYDLIDKYIKVYDAWDYDGVIDGYNKEDRKYGSFVCTVNYSICNDVPNHNSKILDALNNIKASGVQAFFIMLYISEDTAEVHFVEYASDKLSILDNEDMRVVHYNNIYYPSTNSEKTTNVGFVLNEKIMNQYSVDEYIDIIKSSDRDIVSIDNNMDNEITSILLSNTDNVDINIDVDSINDVLICGIDNDVTHIICDSSSYVPLLNCDKQLNSKFLLNQPTGVQETDTLSDKILHTIQDRGTLERSATDMWGTKGTNGYCTVLNSSLVTNMFMEADDCVDVINYRR